MGKTIGPQLLIAVVIFFFFASLTYTGIYNIQASLTQNIQSGTNQSAFTAVYGMTNPYTAVSRCAGTGTAMNFLGGMGCAFLTVQQNDNDTCNNVSGCHSGEANLFHTSTCYGNVNLSAYGINGTLDAPSTYCTAPGLQNQGLCETMGCFWNDVNQMGQTPSMSFSNVPAAQINLWDTVRFVVTFQLDYGLPVAYNWIPNILIGLVIYLMTILGIMFCLPIW
jgi:hypothetical protein